MQQYKIYNIKQVKENFDSPKIKTIKTIIKNYLTKGLIFDSVQNMAGSTYESVKKSIYN